MAHSSSLVACCHSRWNGCDVCGGSVLLWLLRFAFKADTNDTRESPAIRIALELLEEGAEIAHDPKVSEARITQDLGCEPGTGEGKWHIASRPVEAHEGSDACLVLTEWNEYKEIDCTSNISNAQTSMVI